MGGCVPPKPLNPIIAFAILHHFYSSVRKAAMCSGSALCSRSSLCVCVCVCVCVCILYPVSVLPVSICIHFNLSSKCQPKPITISECQPKPTSLRYLLPCMLRSNGTKIRPGSYPSQTVAGPILHGACDLRSARAHFTHHWRNRGV